MTTMNVGETERRLKNDWIKLAQAGGDLDYEKAVFMKKAMSIFGDHFSVFLTECLGIRPQASRKYKNMVAGLDGVPDKKVWRAIGWEGVRVVCYVNSHERRQEVVKAVMAENIRSDKGVLDLVVKTVPQSEIKKPKRARSVQVVVASDVASASKTSADRDVLVAEIRKLISAYPQLAHDLSPEAQQIVGLERPKRRKRAS